MQLKGLQSWDIWYFHILIMIKLKNIIPLPGLQNQQKCQQGLIILPIDISWQFFHNKLRCKFFHHCHFLTKPYIGLHSALIRNLIKLKSTAKLIAQGERVCHKDSKHIFFEILTIQFYSLYQHIGHGRAVQASASRASQIAKSGLLGQQKLVQPFHVLFARISNKIYLESLKHMYLFTLHRSSQIFFWFYLIPHWPTL